VFGSELDACVLRDREFVVVSWERGGGAHSVRGGMVSTSIPSLSLPKHGEKNETKSNREMCVLGRCFVFVS